MIILHIASIPVGMLFALSAVFSYLDGGPIETYKIFPSGESTASQDGTLKYWGVIGVPTNGPDQKSNTYDPLIYVSVMLPLSVIV